MEQQTLNNEDNEVFEWHGKWQLAWHSGQMTELEEVFLLFTEFPGFETNFLARIL